VLPTGVWSREAKKANFPKVVQLATDALKNQSKDLQLALWLTEALVATDGVPGLTSGLNLVRGLLEQFWPTLYPEIDDGDLESRLAPVEWIASRLDTRLYRVPLTKNKLDWLKYDESRRVGYEADVAGDERKAEARRVAVAEKKCTGEEFDEAARNTPPAFFEKLDRDLGAASEAVNPLEAVCDERFGKICPSFAGLKQAISGLQQVVHQYWQPPVAAEEIGPVEADSVSAEEPIEAAPVAAATSAPPAKKWAKAVSEEPADREEAFLRLAQIGAFLRKNDPSNPAGYLVLRSARWGELRRNGGSLDSGLLEPPPTEVRQSLKRFASQGQWSELLEAAENGMAASWSGAWLDLQRFAVRACESLGYSAVAAAIRSELRALLLDLPELSRASLADDTSAANEETKTWIQQTIVPAAPEPPPAAREELLVLRAPVRSEAETDKPDIYELAKAAARAGRVQEAIELISHEITKETSGRGRFTRKVQLAGICMTAKSETVAYPILTEIAEEIESRRLEEWEDGETLATALGLLLRCADLLGVEDAARKKIFQKICRLSPVQALAAMR
jgi:type VI secretion system protein ImpA